MKKWDELGLGVTAFMAANGKHEHRDFLEVRGKAKIEYAS